MTTTLRAFIVALCAALVPFLPAGADEAPRSLEKDVQDLKSEVLALNRDLFVLEEELLYPANTQVAVFVSMDVGELFELDSLELEVDGKSVASYLYTEREVEALREGGVQRLYVGNLRAGRARARRVLQRQRDRTSATTGAARRTASRRASARSTWSCASRTARAISSPSSRSGNGSEAGTLAAALALAARVRIRTLRPGRARARAGSRLRRGPVPLLQGRLLRRDHAAARRADARRAAASRGRGRAPARRPASLLRTAGRRDRDLRADCSTRA